MTLSIKDTSFFNQCSKDILHNTAVQLLDTFTQHGKVTRLEHSVSVAYYSYWVCKKLRMRVDNRSMIRGALLHDFFLYDWRVDKNRKGMHGFTHPKTALYNASTLFGLNKKEKDIIAKHMWPLTVIPPKSREALVVCAMDKYCAVRELMKRGAKHSS